MQENKVTLIGQTEVWKSFKKEVDHLADLDIRVLIMGDSGTGKSSVARYLHQLSKRAERPFIEINGNAMAVAILSDGGKLFTDFQRFFQQAEGGTVYIDEVSSLPLEAQAVLLSVLQHQESESLPPEQGLRLLVSSSRDLEVEVEKGRFRKDLLYRINVATINCPSLKNRRDDIPLMVDHFYENSCQLHGFAEFPIDQTLVTILGSYDWPGNMRELENLIERLVVVGQGVLTCENLPENFSKNLNLVDNIHQEENFRPMTWKEYRRLADTVFLSRTLEYCGGNVSKAGRLLQVDRTTLHKWIVNHKISRNKKDSEKAAVGG